jgi:hypothetical protein
MGLLIQAGPEELVDEIPARVPIKAVGASLIRRQTTAEFLEGARSLRERADADAEEETNWRIF